MNISTINWHRLVLILGIAIAPSAYAQTYFDDVSARSDVVVAIPFGSLEEVSEHWAPNNHDDVSYDPVQDAIQFSWPAFSGSNINQVQVDIDPPGLRQDL